MHFSTPYDKSDLQDFQSEHVKHVITITLLLNVVQQNLYCYFDYNTTRLVHVSPDFILLNVGIIILFLCNSTHTSFAATFKIANVSYDEMTL